MGQSEPVTLSPGAFIFLIIHFYGSKVPHLDAGDDINSFLKG
jgi:hypothetical protein